jgi:hypothetical protein
VSVFCVILERSEESRFLLCLYRQGDAKKKIRGPSASLGMKEGARDLFGWRRVAKVGERISGAVCSK